MSDMRISVNALNTFDELNRAAGDFLIADASTAHTLLDSAELSTDRTDRLRRVEKAREALTTINRFVDRLSLHSKQRSAVEKARDLLQGRLARFEDGAELGGASASSIRPKCWPFAEGVPRVLAPKRTP